MSKKILSLSSMGRVSRIQIRIVVLPVPNLKSCTQTPPKISKVQDPINNPYLKEYKYNCSPKGKHNMPLKNSQPSSLYIYLVLLAFLWGAQFLDHSLWESIVVYPRPGNKDF